MLYMPGSNPRALDKARNLKADCLIFDLEDAVAPDAKQAARGLIVEALGQGGYGGREILVRVNGLASDWGREDLRMAARSGAHGVLLPKVESAGQVQDAEAILREAGAPSDLAIWCMMETPRGILRAEDICAASPRLAGLVMGTSDLAKDLHAAHTRLRLPMLVSLGHCLLAARAFDLAILDGVHLDLDDELGFAEACRQGVELGFDGKTLIHPKTIEAANRIFAPSDSDLAWADKIIAHYQAAKAAGAGVVLVDGKLVEQLHVDQAQRLVALAARIAEMGQ
jgi:citrate lyase subunit beta/citryl-CoA lyase